MKKEKKKNWKKKAAVGAVCVAASAGVIVGGSFDSPADIMNDDGGIISSQQTDDNDGTVSDDEDRQRNRKSAARQWIYSLPAGVRAIVCVPLWFVGWGILHLTALLWEPLGGTVVSWLLTALLVLLAVILTAKAVFPDVPLKKLLRPKLILTVIISVAVFGVIDAVLPVFWEDCPNISGILHLAALALVLGGATVFLVRKRCRLEKKRKENEEKKKELSIEERAMALADTVCKPRY